MTFIKIAISWPQNYMFYLAAEVFANWLQQPPPVNPASENQNLSYVVKEPSIKGRPQSRKEGGLSSADKGVLQMRIPYFLVLKLQIFQNLCYVHTDIGGEGISIEFIFVLRKCGTNNKYKQTKGGVKVVWTFCGQGGQESIFREFLRTSFMDGP